MSDNRRKSKLKRRKKKSSSKKRKMNNSQNTKVPSPISAFAYDNNRNRTSVSLAQTATSPTNNFQAQLTPSQQEDNKMHEQLRDRIITPEHIRSKQLPKYQHTKTDTHSNTITSIHHQKSSVPVFIPLGFNTNEVGISSFKTISFGTQNNKNTTTYTMSTISYTNTPNYNNYNNNNQNHSNNHSQTMSNNMSPVRYHKPMPYNKPLPSLRPRTATFTDGIEDTHSDNSSNRTPSHTPENEQKSEISLASLRSLSKTPRRNSAPYIATPTPTDSSNDKTFELYQPQNKNMNRNANDYSHMLKDVIKPLKTASVDIEHTHTHAQTHSQMNNGYNKKKVAVNKPNINHSKTYSKNGYNKYQIHHNNRNGNVENIQKINHNNNNYTNVYQNNMQKENNNNVHEHNNKQNRVHMNEQKQKPIPNKPVMKMNQNTQNSENKNEAISRANDSQMLQNEQNEMVNKIIQSAPTPIQIQKKQETKTKSTPNKPIVFKPTMIMLPMDTKEEKKEILQPIQPIQQAIQKNKKPRVRRNSDSIVYTPTMSSAINDCSFMDKIDRIQPQINKHRRSQFMTNELDMHKINLNFNEAEIIEMDDEDSESDEIVEMDSCNDTPATPAPSDIQIDQNDHKKQVVFSENSSSNNGMHILALSELDEIKDSANNNNEKRDSVKDVWFNHNVSKRYEESIKQINTMLGFHHNDGWDFDNDYVSIYHRQCHHINYTRLVPSLKDVMYPTMLSSLALPLHSKSKQYIISVKYNMSQLISGTYIKDKTDYLTELMFDNDTTIRIAMQDLMSQIKSRNEHETCLPLLLKLNINCFIFKVCGREEYLKNDKKSNQVKIMSLSFVRNEIRQNHGQNNAAIQEMHNAQFVLMYDDKLCEYDKKKYKAYSLGQMSKIKLIDESNAKLPYQRKGYNCIGDTIKYTINDNKIKESLKKLNDDISNEILYLHKKIPSISTGAQTSVMTDTPTFSNILADKYENKENNVENNIDWNSVQNGVVRLSEFEHEIVFNIKSLKNIKICPRMKENQNHFFTYILRIELMFGAEVFEECSWDIRIPTAMVSDHIKMPTEHCTFSTANTDLYYSCLPREAIWCFTLYGIKKNVSAEQELQKKEKLKNKKQKKHQPKIIRFDHGSHKKKGKTKNTHISAKTIAESDGMIGDANINDFYERRPETTRSNAPTMNGYQFEEKKEDSVYTSEPIAYCKFPMIDNLHRLRKGEYNLHLWQVPVYKYIKGGPKIDPYSTGSYKKFGAVRECQLKKNNKINSVILTIDFVFPSGCEFDVIAPIVNMRRPHYIRTQITPYNKRDYSSRYILYDIIQRDGIFPLDERDKMLIYSNKEKLMRDSGNIPTFLRSVKWLDMECRMEAYDYLEKWSKPTNPEDMIELLRYEFADNRIRLYAINCLNKLDDYTLGKQCLLQLVQALKHELHHSSFLSRFLIIRALNNPFQIGHYLYYHLKSEYDSSIVWKERYGLLLEEYLKYLPFYPLYPGINLTKQKFDEHDLINKLKFISLTIQNYKKSKKKINKKNLTNLLRNELMRLNNDIFSKNNEKKEQKENIITLPLNPSFKIGKLIVDKCKFMSSAKMPLWLVFTNGGKYASEPIETMFKCGDDLRQDILTLQLISIMDSFWLKKNIDLNMKTYQVIGTGFNVGFIELVLHSKTTNTIGSLSTKSHLKYIKSAASHRKWSHLNPKQKSDNYSRSVAGFSVATWALGIGDRHPDNIMIHQNGTLFHIDFGHFLGNFKEKDIGLVKWKREKTPFVFTKCMKYCIENGGIDNKNKNSQKSNNYAQFVRWLFAAYLEIRIRYKFLLNLLLLMVPSQMPELITESDVSFFREVLRFDLANHESIASHVENTLKFCLADKNKKIDDMFHKIKHLK